MALKLEKRKVLLPLSSQKTQRFSTEQNIVLELFLSEKQKPQITQKADVLLYELCCTLPSGSYLFIYLFACLF